MNLFKNFLTRPKDETNGQCNASEKDQHLNDEKDHHLDIVGQYYKRDEIIHLIKEMLDHGLFLDGKYSFRLPCKLEQEPTNKADPNAIKVMVKCPKDRSTEWRCIGYIPREEQKAANKFDAFTQTKEYYWHFHLYFDFTSAPEMELTLRKSKYHN